MSEPQPLLGDAARSDLQGFITSGYGHLTLTAYLFVRIVEPAAGRRWIGNLLETIATAAPGRATTPARPSSRRLP
jgi:hypothetical protein